MQKFKNVTIPSLSSVYVHDGRLANMGSDYSRIPRLRRHNWSAEEKQVLYLLNSTFDNHSTELWKVYKAYFARKSRRRIMPRRCAWETMRAYIANPTRYRVWWTRATTRRLRAEIEKIALSVGVRLLPKQEDETPSTPARRIRKRVSSPSLSGTSDGDHDRDLESSEGDNTKRKLFQEPGTPQARSAKFKLGLLTPPSSQVKRASGGRQVGSPRVVPSIAFRGKSHIQYNISHMDP